MPDDGIRSSSSSSALTNQDLLANLRASAPDNLAEKLAANQEFQGPLRPLTEAETAERELALLQTQAEFDAEWSRQSRIIRQRRLAAELAKRVVPIVPAVKPPSHRDYSAAG